MPYGLNVLGKQCTPTGAAIHFGPSSEVNSSHRGLMSVADKLKLDSIDPNASNITIDENLSSTSTNPLSNRAINLLIAMINNNINLVSRRIDQEAITPSTLASRLVLELEGGAQDNSPILYYNFRYAHALRERTS